MVPLAVALLLSTAGAARRSSPGRHVRELADTELPSTSAILAHTDALVAEPRVPGTAGHAAAQAHITAALRALGWTVSVDAFNETTPLGMRPFANLVATLPGSRGVGGSRERLVLAAHYDSKYFRPPTKFVGASDSAVPCALLLDVAEFVAAERDVLERPVDLVFFDGEEAFLQWSATDSLYGSRHLAAQWEAAGMLDEIGVLVLLDLLGTADTRVPRLPVTDAAVYRVLAEAEQSLRRAGLLQRDAALGPLVSSEELPRASVDDDHAPFAQRGVPVAHVISVPFPSVWHTVQDGRAAVHAATVHDLAAVLRLFVRKLGGMAGPVGA